MRTRDRVGLVLVLLLGAAALAVLLQWRALQNAANEPGTARCHR